MKDKKVVKTAIGVLIGIVVVVLAVMMAIADSRRSVKEDNQKVAQDNNALQEEVSNVSKNKEDNSVTQTSEDMPAAGSDADSDNSVSAMDDTAPVKTHGKLRVDNTQILDKNGNIYQIKGVSTHGLMWFPQYVNEDTFRTIRDEWHANCIRLAMYTGEGGYCTGANQAEMKQLVEKGVQYATDLDMYVIIDWHILSDNNPNEYKDEAKIFFDEMSKKYAGYDNVLYEICNEPNGSVSWGQVKQYAEEVIPVIRANDEDGIIIVGTPTWSQDVDVAAADPIKGYDNIMYAIHFYADTHRESLRNKMITALDKGLPVFCSEFGICDASGNGAINTAEADEWIKLMNDRGVSYCIWNLSNKAESSSLIKAECEKLSGWSRDELSTEAIWYLNVLSPGSALEESKPVVDTGSSKENESVMDTDIVTSDNLSVAVKEENSWDDGSHKYRQLNITIQNNGPDVSSWKVDYILDKDYIIDQSWGGTFTISGKTMTVVNADYNKNIKSGENIKDIGVIIKEK